MSLRRLSFAALAFTMASYASATMPVSAEAQPTPTSKCLAPDYSKTGNLNWFLGLHPSDDLLATWCRLQHLPGNIRFNVLFPVTQAHKSWDTKFEGANLQATTIIDLVQSLIPMTDSPAKDENGMEFPRVLENVYQLASDKIGFASDHPYAEELILTEPIILRVKPIVLAGEEFTLTATLTPNLGLLGLGLDGKATDIRLKGWIGRMNTGGYFGNECSSEIPLCQNLGDQPTFHAPWVLSEVSLVAHGQNMTSAASTIMNQLARSHSSFNITGPSLNMSNGGGYITITDEKSTLELTAESSPGGTNEIKIVWKETGKKEIMTHLNQLGDQFKIGIKKQKAPPSNPDSLDLL